MSDRRRRLRLKLAEAEFERTGNALYVWDGLSAVLEGGQRRVSLPKWIHKYFIDSVVELNHLTFGVVDGKLKPTDAEESFLVALRLRKKGKHRGSYFSQYAQVFTDAPLMLSKRDAEVHDEKIESAVRELEEQYNVSRRTVFEWLGRQREREERQMKLARKHRLLPGD